MPVLFKEISLDLNLSISALGTIWGIDPLAGIIVGLPTGLLADRFGIKKTLMVIAILAGIFCALRGLSTGFLSMAALMFLFGTMAGSIPSVVPKTTIVWFESRHLALTNSLLNIAWSFGTMFGSMTSATILSPMLGGWRNVLLVMGIPAVICGLLWFTVAEHTSHSPTEKKVIVKVPFREAFPMVIRKRQVWLIGLVSLAFWGANTGMIGYLPLYLRNSGWTPVGADGVVTALIGAGMVGSIPMTMLAKRLRAYKGFFFLSAAVMVVTQALIPLVDGQAMWVLLIISAFLRAANMAASNVLLLTSEGVGGIYGGTALGLMSSIAMIGAFLGPPIGNSLAVFHPGAPFFFWAALMAVSLPLFLFLHERRGNGLESKEENPV
jgi:predicted MFS family arabinose efflux permease